MDVGGQDPPIGRDAQRRDQIAVIYARDKTESIAFEHHRAEHIEIEKLRRLSRSIKQRRLDASRGECVRQRGKRRKPDTAGNQPRFSWGIDERKRTAEYRIGIDTDEPARRPVAAPDHTLQVVGFSEQGKLAEAESLFQTHGASINPSDEDRVFEQSWAEMLVAAALQRLSHDYQRENKEQLFDELRVFLTV